LPYAPYKGNVAPMPTSFSIAALHINSYTALIALAALLGSFWALVQLRLRLTPATVSQIINALLLIGLGAILLGRAGYVLLHLDYFQEHTAEILSATAGPGYSEHAALVGALLGWALAQRLRLPLDAGSLIVLASLVGMAASLGCIPNGCAYGREVFWTNGSAWPWALRADWPDIYQVNNPRLPTQLFMAAGLLVLLIVVVSRRKRHGMGNGMLAAWLVWVALLDFGIQFLRADDMLVLGALRVQQWADIVLFTIAGLWLIGLRMHHKRV
jgi:prolipoprotein diacylglyceryltransferase